MTIRSKNSLASWNIIKEISSLAIRYQYNYKHHFFNIFEKHENIYKYFSIKYNYFYFYSNYDIFYTKCLLFYSSKQYLIPNKIMKDFIYFTIKYKNLLHINSKLSRNIIKKCIRYMTNSFILPKKFLNDKKIISIYLLNPYISIVDLFSLLLKNKDINIHINVLIKDYYKQKVNSIFSCDKKIENKISYYRKMFRVF